MQNEKKGILVGFVNTIFLSFAGHYIVQIRKNPIQGCCLTGT